MQFYRVELCMAYDKEELEKFRFSGKILRETREEMRSFVKENMLVIDVCEKAEGLIRAKGGKPAFPCNVSINEVAAHYTSPPRDTPVSVSYTHLRAHETGRNLVCR